MSFILDANVIINLLQKQKPKIDLQKSLDICLDNADVQVCMQKIQQNFY